MKIFINDVKRDMSYYVVNRFTHLPILNQFTRSISLQNDRPVVLSAINQFTC